MQHKHFGSKQGSWSRSPHKNKRSQRLHINNIRAKTTGSSHRNRRNPKNCYKKKNMKGDFSTKQRVSQLKLHKLD